MSRSRPCRSRAIHPASDPLHCVRTREGDCAKADVGCGAVLSVVLAIAVVGQEADAYPSGGALPPPLTLVLPITGSADVPVDARWRGPECHRHEPGCCGVSHGVSMR